MSSDRLVDAVRAVTGFLVADVSLGETVDRITTLARDALGPPVVGVGITMLDDEGRPTTAVCSDGFIRAVDQGQYEQGDGPCLTAFLERRRVRVDDVGEVVSRWPTFADDALAHGVHSTLSLPLHAGEDTFGAFNIYAGQARAFGDGAEDDASLFVTQTSIVLANARAYWTAFDLASGLQDAMRSRAVIEQAKGKIMATNVCSPDEAFDILVRASQRENVKLREIAQRIVER